MKIDQTSLQKIAHLARLNFDAQAAEKEVPTDNVAPLTNMSSEINSFRADEVGVQLTQEQALRNAPKKENGFFTVPKVME